MVVHTISILFVLCLALEPKIETHTVLILKDEVTPGRFMGLPYHIDSFSDGTFIVMSGKVLS